MLLCQSSPNGPTQVLTLYFKVPLGLQVSGDSWVLHLTDHRHPVILLVHLQHQLTGHGVHVWPLLHLWFAWGTRNIPRNQSCVNSYHPGSIGSSPRLNVATLIKTMEVTQDKGKLWVGNGENDSFLLSNLAGEYVRCISTPHNRYYFDLNILHMLSSILKPPTKRQLKVEPLCHLTAYGILEEEKRSAFHPYHHLNLKHLVGCHVV